MGSTMKKTPLIYKIIWIPNYIANPKGFKEWFAMFYNIFLLIAIYRMSTIADNFLKLLGVIVFVYFIFNFIPFQIYRLIIFIFRKKVSQKEKIISKLIFVVIGSFSCFYIWAYFSGPQESKDKLSNYGISYELISEETLEEVCRKNRGCSNTIKRIIESNDGFIFETYLTDSTDSVGCTPNPYDKDEIKHTPCSTVGDFGAGRHFMKITNIKTNKTIKIEAPHVVTRVNTFLDNPNIIFRTSTGGASCCTEYLTYSKNTLELISSKTSFE